MKSFARYISKYLVSVSVLIFILVMLNMLVFAGTFYGTVTKNHGDAFPGNLLKETADNSSITGISDDIKEKLQANGVWAMYLSPEGDCVWTVDLPAGIPTQYTVQDVAVFSRGYLQDYPVFVWDDGEGLLVLGYPIGTYTKITGNYYSTDMLKAVPFYFAGILTLDLLVLFAVYYFSKLKILKHTEPIVSAIQTLADGTPVSLVPSGELSDVADSVNKASEILSRQNEARANWISGVSHDIRTPLTMIMGYAERIADNSSADGTVREQARIMQRQSQKIKTLIEDLNLVSKLEYEMQPLHKETVRLSKLLRMYVADLWNGGLPEAYPLEFEISKEAESITMDCDARLIMRAINNLVQNSMTHNPSGCHIQLALSCSDETVFLTVSDDGVGVHPEKLKELTENIHCVDSSDGRLDLRHGLGLVLVRQITEVHNGTVQIENQVQQGLKTILCFSRQRG